MRANGAHGATVAAEKQYSGLQGTHSFEPVRHICLELQSQLPCSNDPVNWSWTMAQTTLTAVNKCLTIGIVSAIWFSWQL